MINAKQAKLQTQLANQEIASKQFPALMRYIEESIEEAISKGIFFINLEVYNYLDETIDMAENALVMDGYYVDTKENKSKLGISWSK